MELFEEAPIGHAIVDAELCLVWLNAEFARMVGRDARTLLQQPLGRAFEAPAAAMLASRLAPLATARGHVRVNVQHERGILRVIAWSFTEGANAPLRIALLVGDVTEGERTEAALHAAQRRWRVLMESDVFGVAVWRTDGAIVQANDAYLGIVGYSRADLEAGALRWRDITPPEYAHLDQRALDEIVVTGRFSLFEKEYIRKDGTRVRVLIGGGRTESASEGVVYALDITQHRAAEEARRQSELELAEAQRMAHVGSWRYDLGRGHHWYSAELRRIYGLPPGDEPISAEVGLARVHPDDRAQLAEAAAHALAAHCPMDVAHRGLGPNDEVRHLRTRGEPVIVEGTVVGLSGATQDVTPERRAADALRESEGRFRTLVENLGVGVLVADAAGEVRLANRAALDLLGVSQDEMNGGAEWDIVQDDGSPLPAEAHPIRLAIATRQPVRDVVLGVHRRGPKDRAWLLINAEPELDEQGRVREVIASLSDLTERRRLQARVALTDHLASLGTLAAGVAHEINNPLSYVIANLTYLAEEVAARPELESLVEVVRETEEGANRMRDIVRDLRTFSRGDEQPRGPVDLRRVIDSSVNIVWTQIRYAARLRKEIEDLPPVQGSQARLGQVFVNLLANAAQAIAPGAAADNEIAIRAFTDHDRVVVEVSDTGCGIPPENAKRIFDPFFTTKPVGVGTGLGLAVCQGIVTDLGGELSVESSVGKGATFRVVFPIAPSGVPRISGSSSALPAIDRVRVLVVDDEPAIGNSVARLLRGRHDVVAMTSASTALELVTREPTAFDVLLCDVLMPEMDGMELHRRLMAAAPRLARRTVFLTGGAFTESARAFLEHTPHSVLEKPFDVARLMAAIETV